MEKVARTALLGVLINSLIFGIKYLLALFSGSIALKAEAFHSLADMVASATVFGGLAFANKKTRMFPYGLYKLENLVSLIVGIIIIFAGYEITKGAFGSTEGAMNNSWINIVGMSLVIVITYSFSRYEAKVGKETGSPGLTADSGHILVDMIGNILVMVALLSNYIGFNLDKIAAVVVVGFIVWFGAKIIFDAIRVLLDATLDHEVLEQAKEIIASNPRVEQVQNITGRNSGRFKFIEANISINMRQLNKAHNLVDNIERDIRERIKNIGRILIHYEPIDKESRLYALPIEDAKGERISLHFGEAPFFKIVTVLKDNKAIKAEMIKNPFFDAGQGRGILTAEWLSEKEIDILLIRKGFSGKGPLYVFSEYGVNVIQIKEEIVNAALGALGIKNE